MQARYANGRAAVFNDAEIELAPEKLMIRTGEAAIEWDYADLSRTDDHNGRIILRRKKLDTGERIMFGDWYDGELAAVAPHLMKPHAQGVEGRRTVIALVTLAWSLAGAFLVGIPYAADRSDGAGDAGEVSHPNRRHLLVASQRVHGPVRRFR